MSGFEPDEGVRAAQLRPEELLSVLQAHDVEFVVIGYDALIAMKSAAGRDQDVMDIAALGRARGDV